MSIHNFSNSHFDRKRSQDQSPSPERAVEEKTKSRR